MIAASHRKTKLMLNRIAADIAVRTADSGQIKPSLGLRITFSLPIDSTGSLNWLRNSSTYRSRAAMSGNHGTG